MRVAFDLDGVLADLHGAYSRTARELFPGLDAGLLASSKLESPPSPNDDKSDDKEESEVPQVDMAPTLTRQQNRAVWHRLSETPNFWETLDEIEPGAIRRLSDLALERRWDVIFLTSRPYAPGHTLQRQTQRWLERCGFTLPSVFIVPQSRGQIASALELDVVIDDRPEGCLDVVLESKARGILVWRGDAARVPGSAKRLGIGVVSTVAECLDVLVEADSAKDGDGLMGRLKRLLGLRSNK